MSSSGSSAVKIAIGGVPSMFVCSLVSCITPPGR